MLNLHVYEPEELGERDLAEIRRLGFSLDDMSCVVFMTKLTTQPDYFEEWTGWPINPGWRCERKGRWFVFYHA